MTQQHIEKKVRGSVPLLEIQDFDHQPSWLVRCKGTAALKVLSYSVPGGVGLSMMEYAPSTGVTKAVSMTLDENSANALYLFLRDRFEPTPKEPS
jgi:hypothetical protein